MRGGLRLIVLTIGVGVAVAATHWPALSAGALTFDDNQYVTNNHLVRQPGWRSAGTLLGEVLEPSTVGGYYQPLTMISLMLDWARGGRTDNLRPFHQTSLVLHVLNTMLVVIVLHLLLRNVWLAALVGLLFGVHPITIEPVAWLSERKTLLASFFALLSLAFYVGWTRKGGWPLYLGVTAAFVLALLAKPTTTPLPVVLLLLDFWPLRRLSRRAVLEKVPLLVIAGVFGVITLISQGRTADLAMPQDSSAGRMALILCHNVIFYLRNIVWPLNLSAHYPFPRPFGLDSPMVLAGVIGTPILLALLLISLRRTRALLTGWLVFFVAIFPTLGVIGFTLSIAANKYAYLPAIGLLMILTWAGCRAWDASCLGRRGWTRGGVVALGLILTVLLIGMSRKQWPHWHDTETLYRHMLTVAPDSETLHSDLGDELVRQGRVPEAMEHYAEALRINPRSFNAHLGLGNALLTQGTPQADERAAEHFRTAMRLRPRRGAPYAGLGAVLARRGDFPRAQAQLEQALKRDPHMAEVHGTLGAVLARQGRLERAFECYRVALHLKPESVSVRLNYARALVRAGQLGGAEAEFRRVLTAEPDNVAAHAGLAVALAQQGRLEEAISAFEAGLRVAPADRFLQAGLKQARERLAKRGAAQPSVSTSPMGQPGREAPGKDAGQAKTEPP